MRKGLTWMMILPAAVSASIHDLRAAHAVSALCSMRTAMSSRTGSLSGFWTQTRSASSVAASWGSMQDVKSAPELCHIFRQNFRQMLSSRLETPRYHLPRWSRIPPIVVQEQRSRQARR